ESNPGFRWAFDDEGTHLVVEAVGMAPDPPRDRSLERKREGAEDPPGAQPDVLVAAHVDLGSEAVRPLLPQAAIDAVASNNEVGVRNLRQALDLVLGTGDRLRGRPHAWTGCRAGSGG